jgi:hypothetical protein
LLLLLEVLLPGRNKGRQDVRLIASLRVLK